jgi:hypothetical protein
MAVTQYGFHEKLVNRYEDTLNGGITAASTTINVNDATALPTDGFFRLQIGAEIILCNGRSGDALRVETRGVEGTTPAIHADGTDVTCVLTNQGLQQYLLSTNRAEGAAYTQNTSFDDGHAWPIPVNRCSDENNATLTASSFTWYNQGTATLTDSSGGLKMTVPKESGWNLRGVARSAATTPYAVTAKFRFCVAPDNPVGNVSTTWGLWFRDSSTGRLLVLACRAGQAAAMWRFTDWNTYSAIVDTALRCHDVNHLWLRLEDDGTDHKGFFSIDGSNWTQDGSAWWQQGRTAFLATPDQYGFFMSSSSSGGGSGAGNSGAGPAVGTLAIEAFHVEEM